MNNSRIRFIAGLTLTLISAATVCPVFADEGGHCHIDWSKLNLSAQQSQQIQQLQQDWERQYNEIKPGISDDQRKLTRLLADHTSDPVEIMALQQSIARKKEALNAAATANYLKKRQLLNDNQQHSLELMIKQVVAEHQRMMNPGQQIEVMPDRIQDIMQRMRQIWPVNRDQ